MLDLSSGNNCLDSFQRPDVFQGVPFYSGDVAEFAWLQGSDALSESANPSGVISRSHQSLASGRPKIHQILNLLSQATMHAICAHSEFNARLNSSPHSLSDLISLLQMALNEMRR